MSGARKKKGRSGCPLSVSLDIVGDRWSLLIVRDLMVRGYRTFRQFRESGEGIATNVLADRLKKLEAAGIVLREIEEADARRVNYYLTEKGIDLAPVVLEIFVWSARYEETGASAEIIEQMRNNRDWVLEETRRRWRERDATPLIPPVRGQKLRLAASEKKLGLRGPSTGQRPIAQGKGKA